MISTLSTKQDRITYIDDSIYISIGSHDLPTKCVINSTFVLWLLSYFLYIILTVFDFLCSVRVLQTFSLTSHLSQRWRSWPRCQWSMMMMMAFAAANGRPQTLPHVIGESFCVSLAAGRFFEEPWMVVLRSYAFDSENLVGDFATIKNQRRKRLRSDSNRDTHTHTQERYTTQKPNAQLSFCRYIRVCEFVYTINTTQTHQTEKFKEQKTWPQKLP